MPSKSTPMPAVSEDAIRTRAYLMWEADGRPDGRADYYWDLAAAEVLATPRKGRTNGRKPAAPRKKA